eukprot:4846506-Pleurochrysis_carterae.AAC.2
MAFGFDSSSRRTLRASASLSTLRAALIVSARLPTPALRESLTSSSVERLSLRRRTAVGQLSSDRKRSVEPLHRMNEGVAGCHCGFRDSSNLVRMTHRRNSCTGGG